VTNEASSLARKSAHHPGGGWDFNYDEVLKGGRGRDASAVCPRYVLGEMPFQRLNAWAKLDASE
jgi:hypothetical protein